MRPNSNALRYPTNPPDKSFPLRYSTLNRGPVSLRSCHRKSDIPCVRAIPILEGGGENAIIGVVGTRVGVRGVGRGFKHLVVPALVEECLPHMHKGTGVRDKRAEVKS